MSSDMQPEFSLDRSLGNVSARKLREEGQIVHLIADHYPDDAQEIADEDWISEGCRRGWVLLSTDRRIRYRAQELAALQDGLLVCLADGNANLDTISATLLRAMPAIGRAVSRQATGFWHVYGDGTIKRMWL
ncbi:hypothetical protein EXE59_03095 [Nocardioides eburneiflavus]|uniref:VapC45 PIN like domain-containing protein n=1 Tax=Nocardioides eburneiflavus TaxID=2518372 RepID=A0A4Z1CIH1_9ACTN|nr:hypothetical protein [Nocardioides eburneiflavus]TGN63043.1 hypothetical protein EXE59_03095 [Nocardioides eburneiflavus]